MTAPGSPAPDSPAPDSAGQDLAYLAAVRAGLDATVAGVLASPPAQWAVAEHRELARRLLALVVGAAQAGRSGNPDPAGAGPLRTARALATELARRRGPTGLFRGGDNVASPPDSAFSVNDLADAVLVLRAGRDLDVADPDPSDPDPSDPDQSDAGLSDADLLEADLLELLAGAAPALVAGGVHTPNHRWEVSAALARLHRLQPATPQPVGPQPVGPQTVGPQPVGPQPGGPLLDRIEQWLAEGIDLDPDGLFSERSANYAAHVSCPALLTVAAVTGRDDLVDAVEANLAATVDLLLPDGSVETVHSRRQDQYGRVMLAEYLLPLRRVALLRGRGDLAWAAATALDQGLHDPVAAGVALLLEPWTAAVLPDPVPPAATRRRRFGGAGLVVDHRPRATTVVFCGTDYPRHRRVRSGLANSPTFVRLLAGDVVLDSVRVTRTFFGLGPFRADGLRLSENQAGDCEVRAAERVSAAYYLPLAAADRRPDGDYDLEDDGRFSAAMSFGARARQELTLTTEVAVRVDDGRVELEVAVTGPPVDWAIELGFRTGTVVTGGRSLDGTRRLLDVRAPRAVCTAGADAVEVVVLAADAADGGPLAPPDGPVRYEPGEEYAFLGGTDAVAGQRLYVAGRAPGRVLLELLRTRPQPGNR